MKTLLALVAFILTASCGASGGFREPPSYSVAQQYDAAVALHVACISDRGLNTWRGSGVIISRSVVLTAEHVAACDGEALIVGELSDGTQVALFPEALSDDSASDLARLTSVVDLPYVPITIGPRPVRGETICLASAIPIRARSCGEVIGSDSSWIRHRAISDFGNSGSGVYDSRGRLVGITSKLWVCSNGQFCGGVAASLASRWRWFASH